MKVIVAIVEDDICHDISKLLVVKKIRSTRLRSTGGILRKGNSTLIIGCPEDQLNDVLKIIKEISDNRLREPEDNYSYNANVFVMDLNNYKKY